jgi:hypothetical protein
VRTCAPGASCLLQVPQSKLRFPASRPTLVRVRTKPLVRLGADLEMYVDGYLDPRNSGAKRGR